MNDTQPLMPDFFLTNLQKFATEMQIMFDIQKAIAGNDHPIAVGIKVSVRDGLPVEIILMNLRQMCQMKMVFMSDMLGIETVNKILAT